VCIHVLIVHICVRRQLLIVYICVYMQLLIIVHVCECMHVLKLHLHQTLIQVCAHMHTHSHLYAGAHKYTQTHSYTRTFRLIHRETQTHTCITKLHTHKHHTHRSPCQYIQIHQKTHTKYIYRIHSMYIYVQCWNVDRQDIYNQRRLKPSHMQPVRFTCGQYRSNNVCLRRRKCRDVTCSYVTG